MIANLTATSDLRPLKLPADAMHPLFALSVTRKLRHMYEGQYFQYRTNDSLSDYPNSTSGLNGAKLVRIYDQKSRHNIPQFDAVQEDPDLQPTISIENGEPVVNFSMGQFLDLENNPEQYLSSPDFTITAIGDGDFPRPMISAWGNNRITVEPGSPVTRFTFNQNNGSIGKNINNRINQMFSGVDPAQNNKRVLSIQSDGGGSGQVTNSNLGTSFKKISIGREDQRYFNGKFMEATFHLGDLTKVGSYKVWEEAKLNY